MRQIASVIRLLRQCQKEIEEFPLAVREDLADALARLDEGHVLSMLFLGQCHRSVEV